MVLCAYIVSRDEDGEVYAPILKRLETELDAFRMIETPRQRAHRLLIAHAQSTPELKGSNIGASVSSGAGIGIRVISRSSRPTSNSPPLIAK